MEQLVVSSAMTGKKRKDDALKGLTAKGIKGCGMNKSRIHAFFLRSGDK